MSNSENNTNDWKQREIGALWKRESSNQKYLSGKMKVGGEELGVVIFTNRYKEEGLSGLPRKAARRRARCSRYQSVFRRRRLALVREGTL